MAVDEPQALKGQPGLASVALFALCPRCGAKGLFGSLIQFAPRCKGCDLDFTSFNVGDGPAAFVTLIFGGFVCFLAVVTEVKASPPFWVHIVLWVPSMIALTIWGLRLGKAALLAAEHRWRAGEGRVEE